MLMKEKNPMAVISWVEMASRVLYLIFLTTPSLLLDMHRIRRKTHGLLTMIEKVTLFDFLDFTNRYTVVFMKLSLTQSMFLEPRKNSLKSDK